MTSYATLSKSFQQNQYWKDICISELDMVQVNSTGVVQDRLGRLVVYGVLKDNYSYYLCIRMHERADMLDSMISKHGRATVNSAIYFFITNEEAEELNKFINEINDSDAIPKEFKSLLKKIHNRCSGRCDVESLDETDATMWKANKLVHAVAYYHVNSINSNKLRALFFLDNDMTNIKAIVSQLHKLLK